MKIAIATTDGKHINEHFGRARLFAIYRHQDGKMVFEQFRETTIANNGANQKGDNGADGSGDEIDLDQSAEVQRIDALIRTISDCSILYCAEVGPFAAARLVAHKIHPIKVSASVTGGKESYSIKKEIKRFEEMMKTPPLWIRKILQQSVTEPLS